MLDLERGVVGGVDEGRILAVIGADAAPHLQPLFVGAVGEQLQEVEAAIPEALDVRVRPPEREGVPDLRLAEGGLARLDEVLGPRISDLRVVVHGQPGPEAVDEGVDARSGHVVHGRDGVLHPERRVVGVDVGVPSVAVEDQASFAHVRFPIRSGIMASRRRPPAWGVRCRSQRSPRRWARRVRRAGTSRDRDISFQPWTSVSEGNSNSSHAAR